MNHQLENNSTCCSEVTETLTGFLPSEVKPVPLLTSWTFLLPFLDLLPFGELVKRLGSLLKFGDEELNVIQDVVQDLLPK